MLCVNQCLLDSTLLGNSMLIYIVSNRDPTKKDLSRKRLWFFSRALVQNVKVKSFPQQEHSGKLSALVLMGFAVSAAQFLKLLEASIITANVRMFNLDWLWKILEKDIDRGKWTCNIDIIWGKKCLSLMCASVNGNII